MDKNLQVIVKRLKQIPYCEGIIFSGSRLEGRHAPNSDYDFTVLVGQGKSYYKIWKYKNLMVDVCTATADVIKKKDLTDERVANAELHILASGNILYDKHGNMKKIQAAAKKIRGRGPKKPTKNDLREIGYQLKTFLDDLGSEKERGERSSFLLIKFLYEIVQSFFRLNATWLPRSRDVDLAIKKVDRSFFALYQKAGAELSHKTVFDLASYLVKKFDLPQTGETYFLKE